MEGVRSLRADYFASLLYLDDRLGQWYDWARDKGFLKDTLVIITSDHGQAFAEHDAFLHETWMGNEEVHVPYIVVGSNPRTARPVPQGAKISSVVSASLDTLPTIAQAWGFGTRTMRGESLLAFIEAPFDSAQGPAEPVEGPGAHAPDRPAAYSCRGATFRGGNNVLERWTFPNGMIYVKKTDLATKALKEELYNGNVDYSMTAAITDAAMLAAARSESLQAADAPARQSRKRPHADPVTQDRLRALGYVQGPPRSAAFGP